MTVSNKGFRNSESLTRWVRCMLYIQIVVAIISIISNFMEYRLLTDMNNGVYSSREEILTMATANDNRQQIIGISYILVFVISAFLILRWTHRANYNAHQLGAKNMQFTPGWSIGWYFVPIFNLWKPYQAMNEIWKASKNPTNWFCTSSSNILSLWWFLTILNGILGRAIFNLSRKAEEISDFLSLNVITQISDSLDIVLALVFLAIVNRIYEMQTQHLSASTGITHQ